MARQTKSESKLSDAADRATAMLHELQSRLSQPAPEPSGEQPSEDLDRELQEYFVTSEKGVPDQIRDRVIDAVADRILEYWERGNRSELSALENQVIDRVAERILDRMTKRG